ncbi:hypothetical protein NDN08_003932 [Rhodosorus marinus]|uniref:Calmodulin n=1 Tax=Rhodosorus marinus TaxID=101924 RepID=A0AAV8UJT7_9RHOD|nr:hypothetical protein NDN08_003932 [Rhodosorus marinus]
MVKSTMEKLRKRPTWRRGWENLGYSLSTLSEMSECNLMSTLGRPGPYAANCRPVDLGKDTDGDTKERPWHQEVSEPVDEPVKEGVEGDYAELGQGKERQPWEARALVHVADSGRKEGLDVELIASQASVIEPNGGKIDKSYAGLAQETSEGRPWGNSSPKLENLPEPEQSSVDDVELVHPQAPYPEREIISSEDVELSSTTADDNSSCEVKSVDTEELLDHGMESRSPQSGTSASGRKNLPRGDSMKDLGQTVRDDIGVKVHGIADAGVSSYVVRGDTKGLFLGGLAVKSVHLDALWQLSTCRLKEVSLAANRIEKIDLSALSHCQDLETLYLQRNRLCRIDLAPLADCRKLEKVWLQSNELIEIDLGPLKTCTNLRSLYLEDNRLEGSIDLTPLGHIPQLRSLSLKRNRLTGPIVVTPLVSCLDLISCSVDIGVPLVADVAQKDCLPMGLQRHASIIKWQTEERMQRRSQSNANIKLHALLIGFQKNSSQEMTSIMEKYGGFTVSVFEKSVSTVSALKMFDVFIVKLPFLRPHLEEIRAHVPTTPFVLVGSSKDISSVYSFPAERVFEDRLTAQDALEVRDLTRKVIDDDFMVCTSLPATAGAESEVILSFNEEQRKALDLTLSQSRVEELTVENIFRKNDSRVTEEIFRHIARVCYLPVCAAGILYEAVKRDKINHGASSPEVIDYESFSRYWSARLGGFDPEERLYNVLRVDDEKGVRVGGIEKLVSAFLEERASMFHERLALEFAMQVASACLCFALCGSSRSGRPFTMRELRRGNLSKALFDAENGRYEGVALVLRADRVEALLGLLSTVAMKDPTLGVGASRECMKLVNTHKELLIPSAVASVFNRYCDGQDRIGVADLTRFWIAVGEPGARASVEYFFPVLDTDMDGCLSPEDVYSFYKEKEDISRKEGFVIADFRDTWTYVCDMVGVPQGPSRYIRLADLTVLPESSRTFLMQAFLFKNDDMSLLDVRRTMMEAGTRVHVNM